MSGRKQSSRHGLSFLINGNENNFRIPHKYIMSHLLDLNQKNLPFHVTLS